MPSLTIRILCVPNVFDSALHLVHDTLRVAADMSEAVKPPKVLWVTLDGKPVSSASGRQLEPHGLAGRGKSDVVIVPGFFAGDSVEEVVRQSENIAKAGSNRWLKSQYSGGAQIATACTGTWILARSGLLARKQATTTWYFAEVFAKHFPEVKLDTTRMMTSDSGLHCAGAAFAHMDLALGLVTLLFGAEVSRRTASLLLLDERTSQAPYMVPAFLSEEHQELRRLDSWVREHLAEAFSVGDLAKANAMSKRTLARRIAGATGETPVQFVRRLRIDQAVHLLRTTSQTVAEIATSVGYQDAATLRRLVRRTLGQNPRQLRPRH